MLRPKLGAGTMAAVEIVYRYLAEPGAGRPMPADGAAAQRRLEAGNQAFATLLSALEAALRAPGAAAIVVRTSLDAVLPGR